MPVIEYEIQKGSEVQGCESQRKAANVTDQRTGPSSPPACEDDASNLAGWVQEGTFNWRFNAKSHPSEITAAAAESDLVEATRNIVGAKNDCGLADNVNARQRFDGRTSRRVDIRGANTVNPSCATTGDGVSVVDFGRAGSGSAVFLCTYRAREAGPDRVTESDMRLNRDDYEWTVSPTDPSCDGQLGVENYATPGRGNTFGLDPVPEGIHGNLSMSTSPGGPCQNDASSLGLGDVLGLRKLY